MFVPNKVQRHRLDATRFRAMLHSLFVRNMRASYPLEDTTFYFNTSMGETKILSTGRNSIDMSNVIYAVSGIPIMAITFENVRGKYDLIDRLMLVIFSAISRKGKPACFTLQ